MLNNLLSYSSDAGLIAISFLIVVLLLFFITILNLIVHAIKSLILAWSLMNYLAKMHHSGGNYETGNTLTYTWSFLWKKRFKKDMVKKYPKWDPFF